MLAAILLAYLLLLGRALSYDFVWDDVHEIENNRTFDQPLSEGLGKTQTARTDPALVELSMVELAYDSYRPLLFASLWLDFQLWGRDPVALHAVNVLLGAIAIVLAYAIGRRWLGGTLALVPTALFALHPVQIEAIAYVSGRGDVLAGVFALLALLASLRAVDASTRGRALAWSALGSVSFAASLLSKESYIGLPLVIAAVLVVSGRFRTRWWIAVAFVIAAMAYLVLRAQLVTSTGNQTLRAGIYGLPGVWIEYLRIVALPFDLSTERLRDSRYVVPGVVLALASICLAGYCARRGACSTSVKNIYIGVVWMAVLVAPAAVPIVSTNVVADRYFYLPLLGLGVAVTAGAVLAIAWRPRLRRLLAILGALALVLWLFVGWRQVPVWRDNSSLYLNAVAMTPGSSMAHYRVGYLHAQHGQWDEATNRFLHAVALNPRNVVALNNLGVAFLRTGQPANAVAPLDAAIKVNPAHFRAWLNLGIALWSVGERVRGCESIDRALTIHPGYATAARERVNRCGARP